MVKFNQLHLPDVHRRHVLLLDDILDEVGFPGPKGVSGPVTLKKRRACAFFAWSYGGQMYHKRILKF